MDTANGGACQPVYHRRVRLVADSTSKSAADPAANTICLGTAFVPKQRIWRNRPFSPRGRVSISVANLPNPAPRVKDKAKGKGKPPLPVQINYEKERKYFQDIDAFELLEESPSPSRPSTWTSSAPVPPLLVPSLSSALHRWLISCPRPSPSTTLSKVLETEPLSPTPNIQKLFSSQPSCLTNSKLHTHSVASTINKYLLSENSDTSTENIESALKNLSLEPVPTSLLHEDPFETLLAVCSQFAPCTLVDALSGYGNLKSIVKVGEGSYGEVFVAGNAVCKVVPFNGENKVNGETQKSSEELLEEVVLCRTLNHLRSVDGNPQNFCTAFIETLDIKVCKGPYDEWMIKAWDEWDEKHSSENDHPKDLPDEQLFIVFVLNHGGKDLESFVLKNFEEAQSLLAQITAGLAVAEAAFEFEHRDLHWGNILLKRNETDEFHFTIDGRNIAIKTHGLIVSIIDFTLSRINAGEDILFLDLSADPYLFKGPKGDKQAETYRKMKALTDDCWEGSFPRTNVLWLVYLVDVVLFKKTFNRSSKDERELRSLKKRLEKYESAKEAIDDPFFQGMLIG